MKLRVSSLLQNLFEAYWVNQEEWNYYSWKIWHLLFSIGTRGLKVSLITAS